jgi:hypothetical protein
MGMMEKLDELTSSGAREYLTFRLDAEEYGIDILKVQEIRGYESPTRVADAPPFHQGCSQLEGHNCSHRGYAVEVSMRKRGVQLLYGCDYSKFEEPNRWDRGRFCQ